MSQTLSDHVFLICCGGIASIANDYQTAVRKKSFAFPWVHPHPRRSRNAAVFVSICVASWKIVVPLSANALVGPLALLGAGSVCPIPVGALRWASCECVCARDFSG